MSSINRVRREMVTNAVNAKVPAISAERQLKRLTLASMLWDNQFYLNGKTHAELVKDLVAKVDPTKVAYLAEEARSKFKLRHIPLLLARELARHGKLQAQTLTNIVQRPDEMSEFLSIYWQDGKTAVSNQVKKGLAACFNKFNEYQLAKWNKNSAAIKLRDVMFLSHPRPVSDAQAELFKRIAADTLETPDTWETQLSSGADKGKTFTRLINEKKLGALAFLRNLRNMRDSGVSKTLIRSYAQSLDVSKVLPFRYIAAARIVPEFEDMLEAMMFRSLATHAKIPGKTVLLIDVSGSMFGSKISAKSDLDRFDAAAALAILCREVCDEVEIYSFSNSAVKVAPRRGFALAEAINKSQQHNGTALGTSMSQVDSETKYDRVVVFTDEQSFDRPAAPQGKGYIVNVAAYQNGVNHGAWTEISGFSEAVVDYIQALELETV
jgi:60 kDa SS-A/Ro ribonucleoprotein